MARDHFAPRSEATFGLAFLDSLPIAEAAGARSRLARLDRDCGCQAGTLIALAAGGLYVASMALGLIPPGGAVRDIGLGLLVFVLGAIAGKQIGIAFANHQRAVMLGELEGRATRGVQARADRRSDAEVAGHPGSRMTP